MSRNRSILLVVVFGCVLCVDYHPTFDSHLDNGNPHFVWNEALNVMSYHRTKMNEYLCKSYVASEIVENFQNRSGETVEKRVGQPLKNFRLARESLLADPGSQKYKDWLSRSSTLEDIYRQFEHSEGAYTPHQETGHGSEGEVTGFALVDHKHPFSKPSGFDAGFHSMGYHHHHDDDDEEYEEKGMKLKELFHFALTTIAFLAFATFMIEVIMCLMEVQPPIEPDYVLVPTTTGGTGHASKTEGEGPGANRQDRSFLLDPVSTEILNVMSSKVLSTIEGLAILHEDDGQCFRRSLCQSSKYSKELSGTQKIWLPLWSLGASWIAGRLTKDNRSSGVMATLDYLKAAVMGLGTRECHALYPKCDERVRRRKRKVD